MSSALPGTEPILIVEDDESTAELERRALTRAGKRVRIVHGIAEAVALLGKERFSAVLLDYRLPEGTGWPVLEAARALVPRVPVIIVTAAGDERVAAEAIHRGAADYLIKTGNFVEQIPNVLELVLKLNRADDANTLLAAIVESSDDAILSITLDAIITSWNPGAEALFGYTAAEARGMPLTTLVPPEKIPELEELLARVRRGQSIRHRETMRLRKDGTRVEVSVCASPHRDPAGRVVAASAILRDISERRRMEAQLRKAKEEAEAAMNSKGEFLANVSHEIRTPMNGVVGMTSILLDTPLSAEQRGYVETIRSSGDALLAIVNDILDYSKIEAGALDLESHPFALRRCVEESLDLVAAQAAAKGLELCADIDERLPDSLLGDVTRLRQVLVNLVGNAVKFTEAGEVVVALKRSDAGGSWTAEVRDTGIGIAADRLDRLFRPFSQADAGIARKYGGTGLGLAITKRLVESMGGALTVASKVGQGSSFTVTFVTRPSGMRAEVPSRAASALAGRRLLIVDDNETSRRVLCASAAHWGMRAASFSSAAEALAFLESPRDRPPADVAVIDGTMPEMDGYELASAIRRTCGADVLPIVMLTSFGDVTARRGANRCQCAAFVAKPIKVSVLRDALAVAISGAAAEIDPAKSEFDARLAQRQPLRILVAEDNKTNQMVAVQMLKRLGYIADVAANGIETLAAVDRQTYDVIFMDVQMPVLDGLEATRQLIARSPGPERPRIIAMTASAMRRDREVCDEAGMDDYISKPLLVSDLIAALQRATDALSASGRKRARGSGRVSVLAIERGPITALLDLVDGDRATLGELIRDHIQASEGLVGSLRDAVARGDNGALTEAADTLKCSAATFGALALSRSCMALEDLVRSGATSGERAAAALRDIESAHARASAELAMLARMDSAG